MHLITEFVLDLLKNGKIRSLNSEAQIKFFIDYIENIENTKKDIIIYELLDMSKALSCLKCWLFIMEITKRFEIEAKESILEFTKTKSCQISLCLSYSEKDLLELLKGVVCEEELEQSYRTLQFMEEIEYTYMKDYISKHIQFRKHPAYYLERLGNEFDKFLIDKIDFDLFCELENRLHDATPRDTLEKFYKEIGYLIAYEAFEDYEAVEDYDNDYDHDYYDNYQIAKNLWNLPFHTSILKMIYRQSILIYRCKEENNTVQNCNELCIFVQRKSEQLVNIRKRNIIHFVKEVGDTQIGLCKDICKIIAEFIW